VFVFLANNDGEGNAAGCAQAAERLEPHGLHAREPRVPVPVLLVRRAARALITRSGGFLIGGFFFALAMNSV